MDTNRLIVLQAEIQAQLEVSDVVHKTLAERATHLQPASPIVIESVAYQIHNLYGAIEELCQLVAKMFENNITDTARWHSQLLNRMGLLIPGVRPPLLANETIQKPHYLRTFRHFFRHAYGVTLDYQKVEENVRVASEAINHLHRDVTSFLQNLGSQETDV